jgi:hypothetical protein
MMTRWLLDQIVIHKQSFYLLSLEIYTKMLVLGALDTVSLECDVCESIILSAFVKS